MTAPSTADLQQRVQQLYERVLDDVNGASSVDTRILELAARAHRLIEAPVDDPHVPQSDVVVIH